jgi:hypothetical protein
VAELSAPLDAAEFAGLSPASDALSRLPARHQQDIFEWLSRADTTDELARRLEIILRTLALSAEST